MPIRHFLAAISVLAVAIPALADPPPLKQVNRWAHEYTGRRPDPDVRFGTLTNGLRYAIKHNEVPSDGVSMRMRIGSGSMAEHDDEQGLAHFLEHMAFRGSANLADGEVVQALERQGLKLGPDTNAFTSHEQTVYLFNFPKANAEALDTGLTLFREIAQHLTLIPALVEAEKGVILSEERTRDTPTYRASKAELDNLLAGTRAARRWPIGQSETIRTTTSEQLRRYYEANYRPDNTTVVVVGNVDVLTVEQEIQRRFADWKAVRQPEPIALGAADPVRMAVEFVSPGVPERMSMAWVQPNDFFADTEERERERIARALSLAVLNNRLSDRALEAGSPYVSAMTTTNAMLGAARVTQVQLSARPDKWREALDAVAAEVQQALSGSIEADELKRAASMVGTLLQTKALGSQTRNSADVANAIVQSVALDTVFTSPAQDGVSTAHYIAKLQSADVHAALKQIFSGKGPVLFRSSQDHGFGESELSRQLAAAMARPAAKQAAQATRDWPYSDFGERSAVLSTTEDQELGTTLVVFANGTRLLVKPNSLQKGAIEIRAQLGAGRKAISATQARALWMAPMSLLGGLGKLSLGEFQRWAQSMRIPGQLQFQVENNASTFATRTTPGSLLLSMRALTAFARDPGFRPEMGEKFAAMAPTLAGQIESSPWQVFSRELEQLLVGNDPRFVRIPSAQDIQDSRPEDFQPIRSGLATGAADIAMVGDVSVEAAIEATQFTFGSGPSLERPTLPEVSIHMTPGRVEPYRVQHAGRADQAVYGRYWAIPDFYANTHLARTAEVAAALLRARLNDTVRARLGLTYTPRVAASSSVDLPSHGFFGAAIETLPAHFDDFTTVLQTQLDDMATIPAGDDELLRAKRPLLEASQKDRETNAFWTAALVHLMRDPRARTPILNRSADLESVTAGDVQAFIRRFVQGTVPLTVIAMAKPSSE